MSDEQSSQIVRAAVSRWAEPVCALAGLALLAVALVFFIKGWVPRERPHPGSDQIGVLAVMPFDAIGDQPLAAPDKRRLMETLVAEFSRDLTVVPAERSAEFEGSQMVLRDIAKELGADSLLVGSVIAVRGGTRVRARLVHAEDSRELFAVRVHGDDPQQIAAEMRVTILGIAHP